MTEENFIITKEYRRFQEFCAACKKYRYIGLCYGSPGVGKTLSAKHYTNWDLIERCNDKEDMLNKPSIKTPKEVQDYDSTFYTADVVNSPSQILRSINNEIIKLNTAKYDNKFLELAKEKDFSDIEYGKLMVENVYTKNSKNVNLIIIDESDRLKMPSVEQIREIYDKIECGIIFIGMPGLEKKFSRYAQLYSRIGFVHEFRELSQDELLFIMQKQLEKLGVEYNTENFNDQEALLAIIQISRGNFRLVNRLIKQILRIMQVNQIKTVTKEIIYGARECLVIGN